MLLICVDVCRTFKHKLKTNDMRLLLISFLLFFFACKNSNDTSSTGSESSQQDETNATTAVNINSDCGNQILFKEGSRITYAQFDGNGKEFSRQVTIVKSVENQNGNWQSVVEMEDSSNTKMANAEVRYTCDGEKVNFDMQNLFAKNGMEVESVMNADQLSFPLQLKTGETLPDASFKMSAKGGTIFTSAINNRKVESLEKITTPSGTYNCYKITADLNVDIEMPGVPAATVQEIKKNMPASTYTMWFDPSFGVVKMQMYQGGKLQFRSELVNVE